MATADKRIMTDKTGKDIVSELRKIPGAMAPVPVEKGGTGVTTVQEILELIGAEPKHEMDLEEELQKVVRSVNGITPGPDGELRLLNVPSADNLSSEESQVISNEFIEQTTGGSASIQDGRATLGSIHGNSVRSGYAAEYRHYEVFQAEREDDTFAISATIDWDTYIAEVGNVGTNKTFTFTTAWNENPATYGITVSGIPVNGDSIGVYYSAEQRGTITNATPTAFVETNWNLYDSTTGICRVLKYSETYGFKIGGSYTGISFSESLSGTKTVITPDSNGLFSIPNDGYLFVTGGDPTDTYILMTWSDWTNGYEGDFAGHSEDVKDISSLMTEHFPFGLCAVGPVKDEIDFNNQAAYVRIERIAYSAVNLESAEASGRSYTYDTSWIYMVKDTPERVVITFDGSLTVYDHGMEYFVGTTVPVYTELLFGQNLKDKLRTDVLTISSQTLSAAQKQQVQDNISAASKEDLGNFHYASLTPETTQTTIAAAVEAAWTQLPYGKVFMGTVLVNGINRVIMGYRRLGSAGTCIGLNGDGTAVIVTNVNGNFSSYNIGTTNNALMDCGNATISNADDIKNLSPGMYRIAGASTDIFPYGYGILIITKANAYNVALFVPVNSSLYSSVYRRAWNNANNTWYEPKWVSVEKTLTTGTIAKAPNITSANPTLDMNVCRKIGNVVNVSCRMYNISETAENTWFVIPEGYRPTYIVYTTGYMKITGLGFTPIPMAINPNGNVTGYYSSANTAEQVFFCASYPIQ